MRDAPHKLPRLYVTQPLSKDNHIPLSVEQAHYLKNVLRLKIGDQLRAFNGKDGEWLLTLTTLEKKSAEASATKQLTEQDDPKQKIHLYFAPIKKNRMDFLIEKAVELGVTDLHPIITERTEVRKLNTERIKAQIIEAAEQCERSDIPILHPITQLSVLLQNPSFDYTILAALERQDAPHLGMVGTEIGFMIGPEGGFSLEEIKILSNHPKIRAVSLGTRILRAETAALYILSKLG
jgi:16S rRNA (uracil1498-N3)-methyltransferase